MTEIKVERHSYSPGESFETDADGLIVDVVSPDSTRGNFIDVFILVPGANAPTGEELVEDIENEAPDDDADSGAGSDEGTESLADHEKLTARQQGALTGAGYETVGDLPDDLSGLTDINGIGEGTVNTLKVIRGE